MKVFMTGGNTGFSFRYPTIDQALEHLLGEG